MPLENLNTKLYVMLFYITFNKNAASSLLKPSYVCLKFDNYSSRDIPNPFINEKIGPLNYQIDCIWMKHLKPWIDESSYNIIIDIQLCVEA